MSVQNKAWEVLYGDAFALTYCCAELYCSAHLLFVSLSLFGNHDDKLYLSPDTTTSSPLKTTFVLSLNEEF